MQRWMDQRMCIALWNMMYWSESVLSLIAVNIVYLVHSTFCVVLFLDKFLVH